MSSNLDSTLKPRHVHFLGSLPLASSEDVFQRLTTTFPTQLQRIPDGETGTRKGFVMWQKDIFEGSNIRIKSHTPADNEPRVPTISTPTANLAPTYDDFALESYKAFCQLRDEGVISRGIRFQVSLPTPANVICCVVHPEDQVRAEPLYEAALLSCLRRIQDSIPAGDLAIQWDMAVEFALLEFAKLDPQPESKPFYLTNPWFSPLKEGLVERIARLARYVDSSVEMGLHLCYGDARHQHFIQPRDTSLLVEMANKISGAVERDINWLHMPVPIDRTDEAYFAPLRQLKMKGETELFLGLVHADGAEKTEERIRVARKFVSGFGIATECGMGRTGDEEFEKKMDVLAAVTGP
ncbi:hypothetical protein IFR04_012627 [Cadophora malorum]|uniref:Uncharacterized protein n=1 Tax=Cadophora malorum TaxID=108018 RepID=A0A8H7W1B6_9HELO|nr:hypothetical protein IFR04_012627 [Cadophora malorum]